MARGSPRIALVAVLAACASSGGADVRPAPGGPFGAAIAVDVERTGGGRCRIDDPFEVARIAACFGAARPENCLLGNVRTFSFQVTFEHPAGGRATLLATYGSWETFGEPAWSGPLHEEAEQVLGTALRRALLAAPEPQPDPATSVAVGADATRLLRDPVVGDVTDIEVAQPSTTWPWPHR